jgi:hypothetical protein
VKDINAIIGTSNRDVADGVSMIAETQTALDRIRECNTELTALINTIARASHEQSSAISQVNGRISDMDRMTQQNAALVEESTARPPTALPIRPMASARSCRALTSAAAAALATSPARLIPPEGQEPPACPWAMRGTTVMIVSTGTAKPIPADAPEGLVDRGIHPDQTPA